MHIKEKVTGLWARRPRLSGTQGRALKGVAQFFAAMLVCTLIARGTAGATLAVVQTASPRRGELVQGLTADAALSAGEVQNVKAPTGRVLEKYFVPAGGRVEADTPLAQFDPDGVKDALARAKTELARLRLQREKLLAGDTADTSSLSSASTQRDRAQADYNAQKAQNDAAVAAARNDADTAQSALDAANAALAELRAQTDPPASEEALAAAQAAADAAAAALAEKQAALAAAQSAADTAGENAARALADAQAALDTAAKAYEKSKQETEFQNRQNNLDAQTAALDIEKQQAVVDALAALAENDGVLKAGSAGTVSTTVRAISAPDENGRVTVTADVPADAGLRKTQPVTASAELSRTTYEMVLPPEAVRMDNKGSYVLRVEQTQTILGLRNVLSRVDVTVLEQSASGVAVEGPLSPQDVLVKSSARPVAAGDSVRVEQP